MRALIILFVMGVLFPIYSNAQYTPISISRDYSTSHSKQKEVTRNITATVGIAGDWTFKFYSNGLFKSHVWYGDYGKYSTRGKKRNESYSSGNYTITIDEDGNKYVHLYYANGSEDTFELSYRSGKVIVRTPSGAGYTRHEEMNE